ncbi:succinylglutamate-semialdehyde dehydrogenase [Sphingomonas flavalba]|uniref:succinylglutamate-semialdehyde dehydrogenase n=1 Tax=Sphingomonas flavalba TaxID=2559804 RepID=UPI0039DF73E1
MGDRLRSTCPSDDSLVWEGAVDDAAACAAAVARARAAQPGWAETPLDTRIALVRRFAECVTARAEALATLIARETGKPLWETRTEANGVAAKVAVSIAAQAERAGERRAATAFGESVLRHRPHGVLAVLGPFNFPAHLPSGHIIPALLAGNCVVFKPSEHTPAVGEMLVALWRESGLPHGVLELVQGGRETGAALVDCPIDGLLFTGSARAGLHFQQHFATRAGFMLALELGGNNPLIAWDGGADFAAATIAQSAFLTAGQRCSCARRLIVRDDAGGRAIVDAAVALAGRLRIGRWNAEPQPFMGSLISADAAAGIDRAVDRLVAQGGRLLSPAPGALPGHAFRAPAVVDMTDATRDDTEIFGPVLQLVRVAGFDDAIAAANNTAYGLSAALLTADDTLWGRFLARSRAGVVNRNRPTNGAASNLPFGGTGASGNHRPSAWYAADYCAYPVASAEAGTLDTTAPDLTAFLAPARP